MFTWLYTRCYTTEKDITASNRLLIPPFHPLIEAAGKGGGGRSHVPNFTYKYLECLELCCNY